MKVGRTAIVPEAVFVEAAMMAQDNNCPPFHSELDHNFYITRWRHCPYCMLGSEPVHHTLVDQLNGHGRLVVVKKFEKVDRVNKAKSDDFFSEVYE